LIFGIGGLAGSAYGMLLLPLYVRRISAREYGVFSLMMLALSLIVIVLRMGLNHAFFRQYYETDDPERRRRIVGSALVFLIISSATVIALMYPAAPRLSAMLLGGDRGRASLMRLVLITCFFEVITLVPESILRAKFKSLRYSVLNIVALAFQLGAISYLVLFVDASATGIIVGRLAGTIFEAMIFYVAVRRELSLGISLAETRAMLAFGSPLVLSQLLSTLFVMIDRFFVDRYGSEGDVGVYSLACSVVLLISVLITVPFSQVWSVMRFSVMNEEGATEYYSRVLTYVTIASMFLALLLAAVAGDGLLLKADRSYWRASAIIPLLAFSAVFDTASQVLNVGITLRKRTLFSPLITGLALAVNVTLNFMFIPRFGPLGASISTLLSYMAFCVLRFWFSNLFFKVEYEWTRVFNSLTIGGLLLLAFYVIDHYRGPEPGTRILVYSLTFKLLLALSFPALLYLAGFFNKRELQRLSQLATKLRAIPPGNSANRALATAPLAATAAGGSTTDSSANQRIQPEPGPGDQDSGPSSRNNVG
jgi:O-antigen/teichoic acid export membrane protein